MKSTSFFCEACSKPVPRKAQKCPHCGRQFDSVKCPQCSFAGRAVLFNNGCPSCGYLQKGQNKNTPVSFDDVEKGLVAPDAEGIEIGLVSESERIAATKRNSGRSIPRWVYTVMTFVLLALLFGIIIVYIRL